MSTSATAYICDECRTLVWIPEDCCPGAGMEKLTYAYRESEAGHPFYELIDSEPYIKEHLPEELFDV